MQKILYDSAALEHLQFVQPTFPTEVSTQKSFNSYHK